MRDNQEKNQLFVNNLKNVFDTLNSVLKPLHLGCEERGISARWFLGYPLYFLDL